MREVMKRWQPADRILDGYAADRAARPDAVILAEAGFELLRRQEFSITRHWTLD